MQVRFEINNDELAQPRVVVPFSGKDLSLNYELQDEPKFDFLTKIKDLTFVGDDFDFFNALETSDNNCDLQTVRVLLNCGFASEDHQLFKGTFSMSSGTWDLDKCNVKFKIDEEDPYSCIENNDDDHNILTFTGPRTIGLNLEIGLESYICHILGLNGYPQCTSLPDDELWTKVVFNGFYGCYVRQYMVAPNDYMPSSSWIYYEDVADGKKYIRRYIPSDNEILFEFPDSGPVLTTEPVNTIDNGRQLQNVMETLLLRACFDIGSRLDLVSDFFQWNPENVTTINYVTQELNKFMNLIIFQKSDVKRPDVSGNATKAETNFIELLEQVCGIFNCRYRVIGTTLRIEHLSWFQRDLGIDLATPDNLERFLKGTRKYSYDDNKLPKYESFQFMESGSVDFVGKDIYYEGNCVNDDKENKPTVNIDKVTTDVIYCMENRQSDSNNVSDDGFVIMACDDNNNVYYEDSILGGNTSLNNVLSWAHLHDKLFRHGRVLKNGFLNDVATEFISTVPTIKQDKFSVSMDCQTLPYFDPIDQIKASLG